MKTTKGNLLLLLTAFIWGTAFVAQSEGIKHIGPLAFNGIRSLLGTLALLPLALLRRRKNDASVPVRLRVKGGIICGLVLTVASTLQQYGIQDTTTGKAGFLSALYIIIVPFLQSFFGKKPSKVIWFATALALTGMYFLCMSEGFTVGKGDLLVILSAFGFSFHILVIDRYSPLIDGVTLSCIQFFVVSVLCTAGMFLFEEISFAAVRSASISLLYAGLLSSGVAYTLQIIGQKYTTPVFASLFMSFESVFAALAGWAVQGSELSVREILGCVLMFAAVLTAQFLPTLLMQKRRRTT